LLSRAREGSAALPEIRRSLDSTEANEVASALRGVLALKDSASRPAVEKLTTHSDPWVAKAAKEALAAL